MNPANISHRCCSWPHNKGVFKLATTTWVLLATATVATAQTVPCADSSYSGPVGNGTPYPIGLTPAEITLWSGYGNVTGYKTVSDSGSVSCGGTTYPLGGKLTVKQSGQSGTPCANGEKLLASTPADIVTGATQYTVFLGVFTTPLLDSYSTSLSVLPMIVSRSSFNYPKIFVYVTFGGVACPGTPLADLYSV